MHPNSINSSYVKLSGNALQAGDIFYSVIWVGLLSVVSGHELSTWKTSSNRKSYSLLSWLKLLGCKNEPMSDKICEHIFSVEIHYASIPCIHLKCNHSLIHRNMYNSTLHRAKFKLQDYDCDNTIWSVGNVRLFSCLGERKADRQSPCLTYNRIQVTVTVQKYMLLCAAKSTELNCWAR